MLVKNWMRRQVITVSPQASMYMARELMTQNNIHALPVIKNSRVVGLLTDRDLKRAEASDATTLDVFELNYLLKKLKISEIMTPNPHTIAYDRTLSEAAHLLLEEQLEAVPVMNGNDQLMGILTRTDLERAFLILTAFGRKGIQFGIRIDETPGTLMAVIDAVRGGGCRLASLITSDPSTDPPARDAYLHVYEVDRSKLLDLTNALSTCGTLLYVVDLKTGERHLFKGKEIDE